MKKNIWSRSREHVTHNPIASNYLYLSSQL